MSFQSEPGVIRWNMHFTSPPGQVDAAPATDLDVPASGPRPRRRDGRITFHILNYEPFSGRVLRRVSPVQLSHDYFGTIVEFTRAADGFGGTELSRVETR